MNILIDTCTWLKLDKLTNLNLISIDLIYNSAEIMVTPDVASELEYYNCNSWRKEKTLFLPIKNDKIYEEAIVYNFDKADASILSNGSKDFTSIIITEDRNLIQFAKIYKFVVQQLIDFFRFLVELNIITKNLLSKINKILRDIKNITVKKERQIKNWLAETR